MFPDFEENVYTNVEFFFISGVFDLLITKVSLRDDGEFYCQVKNQSQEIIHKKRVNLTVLGKY